MRISLYLILLITMGSQALCQDTKLSNTLLWRISGNGLQKPSYLYGTMHLTDKRVFQLGDSVYNALERTEGFAAELDMNRIGTQMINLFVKENEEKRAKEPDKVKDKISEQVWNLYKERLEKKFDKKAEKLTVDDLDDVESKLKQELFKKGDMPSFLDAWLFGQARKQGKWVGGIEDIEDQLEHISDEDIEEKIQLALFDDNYYRGSLDWFIKVYTEQRLDTIDTYMYRENGKKDFIMIKRNLKMTHRIDSLSAIRSTLFAVGAAHLPGDSGIIAILRSRGFVVTPVQSSKKISPDKYVSKKGEAPWFPCVSKDSSYALQMPGIAEGLEVFESMGLDLKLFFDISFMKMYMTFGVDISEQRRKLGADSLFNGFRNQYGDKGRLLKEKKIFVNGIEGREYRISTDDGEMRIQVFLPGLERVILNAVFSFSEKSLNEPESEKFFQSFVYNAGFKRVEKSEVKWSRMDFPLQSFSIELPLKPKETKDVVSDEGRISYNWQGMDIINQVFYGINVSLMKEGMYDESSDSTAFFSVKDRLKEGLENAVITDSSFVVINGYPGYSLTLRGKSKGEEVGMAIHILKRGGLNYYLYAVYSNGTDGESSGKRFLSSFRLLPYISQEWKKTISPDGSFSTTSAFAIRPYDDAEVDFNPASSRFIMYDSLMAVTGYMYKTILPAWLWYSTDTGFLRSKALQYKLWNDSVVSYKFETSGNMKIASLTVAREGSYIVKKVKLVLNGNELYEVFGFFASRDLTDLYDRFFDDFTVLAEKQAGKQGASRINDLARVLKNADKKTMREVIEWWDYLEFSNDDIPMLQGMLLKIYPDFDSSYYNNFNKALFEKIEFLDSTHTTVKFIRNNYGAIQPGDEYIKPFIISYLSRIVTAESYTVLKECLTGYPLNINQPAYFPMWLYDSLKLTATLFPEVMKLAGSEAIWENICGITKTLIDSSLLSKNTVKEYSQYFIQTAQRELNKEKQEVEDAGYSYTDLIRLLGIINSTESKTLLSRFSKFDNRELKFRTTITLLENNLPVDNRNFLTFAMIDEYRHELYDELKRINKLKFFPASFLSQKQLAKSKLYYFASEDDYTPDQITDIGERTVLYKGKQQKFYLFKVSFDGGDSYYLGVAGPYPVNVKDMNSDHTVTGIYWDQELSTTNPDELFSAYLKMLEDDEGDKNE